MKVISEQFNLSLKNPIVRNHRVYSQELLPGLAYIDIIYQVFQKHHYPYNELELRNLSIKFPLAVAPDTDILLNIKCEEIKEGLWRISAEDQTQNNEDKKCYISAEMHRIVPKVFKETLDVEKIKQSANRVISLDEVYEHCRQRELVHTGFMKAKGSIYDTGEGLIIDASLGQEALPHAERFMFHPTLIDGSGVGLGVLLSSMIKDEQQLYLPLFYESFSAAALLQKNCITRVKRTCVMQRKELIYVTMEFFNDTGEKVAELKNFAYKLVRGNQLIETGERNAESPVITEVELFLRKLLAAHLKQPVEQIKTNLGYYEMGLNSTGLLEVVKEIENKINKSLSPTLLFEYTTIAELSQYLQGEYPEQFRQATMEPKTPVADFKNCDIPQKNICETNDIAIIGMAGRCPKSENLLEFWNNLKEGKDCITEIPKSRWDWKQYEGVKSPSGKSISRWGGFIDNHDCFDAQFFRISPREAELLDPQERLFLETCWEAIEDAGYTPKTLVPSNGSGKRRHAGVFVGVMHKDYSLVGAEKIFNDEVTPLSLNYSPIANRVSYFCNFHGPSIAVDTACSSSLTALHLALESIRHEECEVALAGGVNLSLFPGKYLTYGMAGMYSSDGRCHTFGKGGDGYVSSEGVGAVLLKPLKKAVEDGDNIYAVIKGSAINHVGTVSGITVPSPVGQADVIVSCLEKSGVNPRTVSYIEAHGTGTSLGDPIEIQGLVKAYSEYTEDLQFCSIGSVKSNIGHPEAASGIMGIIKVALQLHHKTLVPSLHSEELNTYINFKESPFYVQQHSQEWKQPVIIENDQEILCSRRAGVSSFGATGSNAHVILEEYLHEETDSTALTPSASDPAVIVLSAKDKERLIAYSDKMLSFLKISTQNKNLGKIKQTEKTEFQGIIEAKIKSILAEIIQVEESAIDIDQDWNEYEIGPFHMLQIKEKIQNELGARLDINELLQRNSIASAAAYLVDRNNDESKIRSFKDASNETEGKIDTEIDLCSNEINLQELAYTLQVGREAMEERVVFLVKDIPELMEKLEAFKDGNNTINNCLHGSTKQGREALELLSNDAYSKEIIHKWIDTNNLEKIAELWVRGYEMDWELLYKNKPVRRISLPTYPFARERYWIPETSSKPKVTLDMASIHPLLQQNTSDLSEQRFSSVFTGKEFFLADHRVKGQKVLPGVAYLEMARAAVEQAAGALKEGTKGIRLKDVVWIRPVVVDEPIDLHIGLYPEDNEEIAFEIYSLSKEADEEPLVHCQGSAEFCQGTENYSLDLEALKAECMKSTFSSLRCYDFLKGLGIDYGPAHQGIEEVYVGHKQAMAKLSLPSSILDTKDKFKVHPSLADSALQSSICLFINEDDSSSKDGSKSIKPVMPFALQEIEVLGGCTSEMWALVRHSEGSKAGDTVQKLDIDMCDERGNVCVRMKGFSSRALEGDLQAGNKPKTVQSEESVKPPVGNLMLVPVWDSTMVEKGQNFSSSLGQTVIVGINEDNEKGIKQYCPNSHMVDINQGDTIDIIAKKLEEYDCIQHIVWVAPKNSLKSMTDDSLIKEQDQGVLQCFNMLKALLSLGYGSKELGWSVITTQGLPIHKKDIVNPVHASIHGFIGSMAKEHTNWKFRLVDVEAGCEWPSKDIFNLPADRRGRSWVYRNGEWFRQHLIPIKELASDNELYKPGGVYVVIGGSGGVGEVWSEYMIRTYNANIVWIGRREKDSIIQGKLDRLADLGNAPLYIRADATKLTDLQQAYKEIKSRYSKINGVIHSAMVFSEESLANMEEKEFRAGLSAKVDVSVRIGQVFHEESLDFVLFFSSLISCIKNPRQSHYASGCTFMDAYAHMLSIEWSCAVKIMNWGYWGSFKPDAAEELQHLTQIGLGLIQAEDGMKALDVLLAGSVNQIALIKTTKPLVVEGMIPEEMITDSKQRLPHFVSKIEKFIPNRNIPNYKMQPGKDKQMKDMEELIHRLLWGQLQAIGLFREKTLVISELKKKTGLRNFYDRWLQETIMVLARKNYLETDGTFLTVLDDTPIDMDNVWQEWDKQKGLWMQDSNLKAQVNLIEATLRKLPEILLGKVQATEVMFPNSSTELVEGIYKHNEIADYYNEVLSDTLVAHVKQCLEEDPLRKIRILEIGAGTGGTSAGIFKKLQPFRDNIQEYCYTDISKAFLMFAEKQYGPQNSYLTYKIFDLGVPAASQDIDLGSYDIAIAANVLHATKNIRQTMRNAKAVLKENGLILLNELSSSSLFTHLTFGLLEGWWLYEDQGLRIPGCPGLYPKTWEKVLETEGFRFVFFPASEAHYLGQQIVAAESDGIIRQKELLKLPVIKGDQPEFKKAGGTVPDSLREKSTTYIKELVGETLKMLPSKIDSSEPLERYGIDSILVVQLTNALREVLDNISSTIFFEYQTIDALVEHLLNTQKDSMAKLVGLVENQLSKKVSMDEKVIPLKTAKVHKPMPRKSSRFMRFKENEAAAPQPKSAYLEDIAVVGISGRYAQAGNIGEFWNNLKEGRNCITEIPKERWNWEENFHKERGKKGKIYTRWGGFIKEIDKFDPLFFHISPLEAEKMDPQERLFLETVYASIEDAGYTPANLCESRKIGVFAGVMNGNYSEGVNYWSVANRVSYVFNFQGPSIAVDTACSSSLTAIHLALESLYSGSCDCAIAGGVNLVVDPVHYLRLTAVNMLSSSDKCRSFGENADGFVDGEGVGAVVLKPLPKAIAEGDHIYGIIKGSMINAGGKTNGYTVPNPNAQHQLITDVLQRTGIHARTISYIEAHGTGTSLGDPIEITGLTKAFEENTKDRQYCALGSVKSNIGHCESAAGVAGLTKVLLQLKHGQLVPSLHSKVLNPNIDFGNTPFVVQQELTDWKRPVVEMNGQIREYPRTAGISAFGAGGANAHLVIQEYMRSHEDTNTSISTPGPQAVVLSAKNQERLVEVVSQMLDFVEANENLSLPNLAFTLQVGREAMEYRLAMVVNTQEELIKSLKEYLKSSGPYSTEEAIPIYTGSPGDGNSDINILLSGKTGEILLQSLLEEKSLDKLALYWAKGGKVSWKDLYNGERIQRMSLPTYPFARESYWLSSKQKNKPVIKEEPELIEVDQLVEETKENDLLDIPNYAENIVRDILRLPSNCVIDPEKQLMEYGMNSITGMQIHEKIKRELDIEIDGTQFFAEFTLKEIIRQVELLKGSVAAVSSGETESLFPWEKDKELTERITLGIEAVPFKHNQTPESIFITGITGLLGAFLCSEILEKTQAMVYGLVRAETKALASRRIKDNLKKYGLWKTNYQKRIIPIQGDITKPELGIKKELYNTLSQSVERIYHCGAVANHVLNYNSLKASNVDSTLSVIEFAGNMKIKPVHFISSGIVCIRMKEDGFLPTHQSETPIEEGKYLVNGYAQTKWVSEHHLLKAWEKGIPVTIFRCGQITGSSKTGYGVAADMVHNFLKTFSEVKVVPKWEDSVIEMVPVDYISQAIFAVSQQSDCYGKIYHPANPHPIQVQEFFEFLQSRNPCIKKVTFDEWADCCLEYVESLSDVSTKTILKPFFTKAKSGRRLFENYFKDIKLNSEGIQKVLDKAGVQFPKMDEVWLEKCLSQISLLE